jgi:ribosomal protein S21
MGVVHVRVEARTGGRFSDYDRERQYKVMMKEFRNKLGEYGVIKEYKDRRYFESRTRKARKKIRDTVNRRKQDAIEERLRKGDSVTDEPACLSAKCVVE